MYHILAKQEILVCCTIPAALRISCVSSVRLAATDSLTSLGSLQAPHQCYFADQMTTNTPHQLRQLHALGSYGLSDITRQPASARFIFCFLSPRPGADNQTGVQLSCSAVAV